MTLGQQAEDPPSNKNRLRGKLTLLTGIFMMMFCGNFYLWGNICTYVVSYFRL